MLTGPALGSALRAAMHALGVTQATVAREFGITQPSVSEWAKHGRIDKAHINHLVAYFSSVARPSHWGLPDDWGRLADVAPLAAAEFSPSALRVAAIYDKVSPRNQGYIDAIAQAVLSDEPALATAPTAGKALPAPAPTPSQGLLL